MLADFTVSLTFGSKRIEAYRRTEACMQAALTVDTNITLRLNENIAEQRHNQLVGLIEGTPFGGSVAGPSVVAD